MTFVNVFEVKQKPIQVSLIFAEGVAQWQSSILFMGFSAQSLVTQRIFQNFRF